MTVLEAARAVFARFFASFARDASLQSRYVYYLCIYVDTIGHAPPDYVDCCRETRAVEAHRTLGVV